MRKFYESLNAIEKISGTNAKQEALAQLLVEFPFAHEFFRRTYDNTVYGVGKKSFEKIVSYDMSQGLYFDEGELIGNRASGSIFFTWDEVLKFLVKIESTSGNELLRILSVLKTLDKNQAKWLTRLLLKDLKLGLSLISVNKIFTIRGLDKIEKFEVQLCDKIDVLTEENVEKSVGLPCMVCLKYDGMRGFLTKTGTKVTFTSRQGENIEYVPELIDHFTRYDGDFVLDGEILCPDFNSLQQRIGRKLENIRPIEGLHFRCFDIISVAGTLFSNCTQLKRSNELRDLFPEDERLKHEEMFVADTFDQIQEYFKEVCARKQEGIILKKLDGVYEFGKRKMWVKVKPLTEHTFRITGGKYGTGKKSQFISTLFVSDASGMIKSGVGSGLTDDMLFDVLQLERSGKLVGTCVDVAYNEITKDTNGEYSLRFPRVLKLRYDKTEPDNIEIR